MSFPTGTSPGAPLGREKAVVDAPCARCGTGLKTVAQRDGSVAREACPTCYPPDLERASLEVFPRREHGTFVPPSDEPDPEGVDE